MTTEFIRDNLRNQELIRLELEMASLESRREYVQLQVAARVYARLLLGQSHNDLFKQYVESISSIDPYSLLRSSSADPTVKRNQNEEHWEAIEKLKKIIDELFSHHVGRSTSNSIKLLGLGVIDDGR